MKNISNIVLNDFTNDSHVPKTSNSMVKFGYRITVITIENSINSFKDPLEILINKNYKKIVSNIIATSKFFCWEALEKVI